MSTRRGFFGLIGGAAAAIALDPDRALWRPGAKLISIPRVLAPGDRFACVAVPEIDFQSFVDRYVEPAIRLIAARWDEEVLYQHAIVDGIVVSRFGSGCCEVHLPAARFRMPSDYVAHGLVPAPILGIPIRWVGHPDGTTLVL